MSLVLVHGTGVRLSGYTQTLETARSVASVVGLDEPFVECAWGDPLGVEFRGASLPDLPGAKSEQEDAADFAQWKWLFDDPLFELQQLTIRDTAVPDAVPRPGVRPEWLALWESISAYRPSTELGLLLDRGGLRPYWDTCWSRIVHASSVPREAFEASAHELPEASHALARAVVASLFVVADEAGGCGPSRALRKSLVDRLVLDWGQRVLGLGSFFATIISRLTTSALRRHRNSLSRAVAEPVGDILLYQSRGEQIREFIRDKIATSQPPVTVVAHSLGGIASMELLASPDPPAVSRLVTLGSQAPLLYELGALGALKPPQSLPESFPPWLNIYDRNDFLSYVAGRVWPEVEDHEVESGQPFPQAHSAYFGNDACWTAIKAFVEQ